MYLKVSSNSAALIISRNVNSPSSLATSKIVLAGIYVIHIKRFLQLS